MKKLLVLAFACSLMACSAAQQRAEIDLGISNTACVLGKLNLPFSQALTECGLANLTDATKRNELLTLFTSAQSGAMKAGAKLPGADAGAP